MRHRLARFYHCSNLGDAQSRHIGKCGRCAVLSSDARSLDAVPGGGPNGVSYRHFTGFGVPPSWRFSTGANVRRHPDAVATFQHFAIIRDRLSSVSCDTHSGEEMTQLLVTKSHQEIIFQAAHHSPMAGHLGCNKTCEWIMARFYWPGIYADIQRWCASRMSAKQSTGHPKSPVAATSINFDSFRKNCNGSRH